VTLHALSEVAAALGGLGGAGAIITGIAALREARRVRSSVEPNHGSSLADAARRTEAAIAEIRDDVRSLDHRLGYELGEIRRGADREHADYDTRLRALESRSAPVPRARR
jgi:hypothetical protein